MLLKGLEVYAPKKEHDSGAYSYTRVGKRGHARGFARIYDRCYGCLIQRTGQQLQNGDSVLQEICRSWFWWPGDEKIALGKPLWPSCRKPEKRRPPGARPHLFLTIDPQS